MSAVLPPAERAAAPLLAPSILPGKVATGGHLDPAVALAFRTPVHEHLLSADGKAAGILTLLGIMFAVLARCGEIIHLMIRNGVLARGACLLLLGTFAGSAIAAVVQAFRTISPRFPPSKPSLAFFGRIAATSCDAYTAAVWELTPEAALEQILNYNHTASQISLEKYRQLRRGLRCFQLAFLTWLPLVALLAIWGLWS